MRLISCHIENFGALENLDIKFNKNMNSYCKENGVGKTTLATFIKAMFYGFEKKKSLEFPDRLHYFPFKGGNINYGGNLVFEAKGKIYKIERIFDAKSDSKDFIEVKDQYGNTINCGDALGEYFFNIDLKSFEKTLFVSNEDLSIKTTESINKKLLGFVNDIDESKINKILSEKIKSLESTRKNSIGIIEGYNIKINNVEQQIAQANILLANLGLKYNKYNQLNEEINKLYKQKDQLKNLEVYNAKYEAINTKKKEIEANKKLKQALDNKYQKGLPSSSELDELKKLCQNGDRLAVKEAEYRLNENEEKSFLELQNTYHDNAFTFDEISSLRASIANKNQAIIRKKDYLISKPDDVELLKLSKIFNNGEVAKEEIEKYDSLVLNWLKEESLLKDNSFNEDKNIANIKNRFIFSKPSATELDDINNNIKEYEDNNLKIDAYNQSVYSHKPSKFRLKGLIMALSLILFIVGVCLLFFMLYLGITLSLIGIIIFLIAILFIKVDKTIINKKSLEQITDLKAKNNVIANQLRAYFANYRLSSDNFSFNLERLKMDLDALTEYEQLENKNKQKLFDLVKKHNEDKQRIIQFYNQYECIDNDISRLPSLLKDKLLHYKSLKNQKQLYNNNINKEDMIINEENNKINNIFSRHNILLENELDDVVVQKLELDSSKYQSLKEKTKKLADINKAIKENDDKISAILSKYSLSKNFDFQNQYLDLKKDKDEYDRLINKIAFDKDDLETFIKNNKLNDIIIDDNIDLDDEAIDKKINELNINLSTIDNEIKEDENIINNVDDLKAEIQRLTQNKNKSIERLDDLKILQQCFLEAEGNLKEKYITPIFSSFIKFTNKISSKLSLNVKMDYDFNLKYDILGKERDYKHLSEGLKTCLALCMRLAIIENMYKDEKLFMILDDPFTSLDQNNINKCIEVLKELSKESQIIYFCCHESRSI